MANPKAGPPGGGPLPSGADCATLGSMRARRAGRGGLPGGTGEASIGRSKPRTV